MARAEGAEIVVVVMLLPLASASLCTGPEQASSQTF
jgi:hypothetical protein